MTSQDENARDVKPRRTMTLEEAKAIVAQGPRYAAIVARLHEIAVAKGVTK
jgi:hypothetical protein